MMSAIYIVDIVLLVILYLLIMFMCGYSVFCVYRILRSMQMRILLRPTRVVFSHRKEGESTEELRTVVAYQNPFTGDYCVNKARRGRRGAEHPASPGAPASPDSGLSDQYEPLRPALPAPLTPLTPLGQFHKELQRQQTMAGQETPEIVKIHMRTALNDNSVNRAWNWNYKEYQI